MIKFRAIGSSGKNKTFDSYIFSLNEKNNRLKERIFISKDENINKDKKFDTIISDSKPILKKQYKINEMLFINDNGKFEINI